MGFNTVRAGVGARANGADVWLLFSVGIQVAFEMLGAGRDMVAAWVWTWMRMRTANLLSLWLWFAGSGGICCSGWRVRI